MQSQSGICNKRKELFLWSRELTGKLIELYEQYPCLYHIRLQEYKNRNIRSKALEEITLEFNRNFLTNLTTQDVQKKIHGIRTQYFNEINKMKKSKLSGASTDSIYTPKLWCYQRLLFLNEGTNVVSMGESNLSESMSEAQWEDTKEEISQAEVHDVKNIIVKRTTPTASPLSSPQLSRPSSSHSNYSASTAPKIRKKDSKEEIKNLITTATTLQNLTGNVSNGEPSSNFLFGQLLVSEMEKINDESILDRLKQNILSLLFQSKQEYRENIQ